MTEKEALTQKFINVRMDEIKISTDEYPIIGTEGLGPCIAFILYSKEHKKAIVGHISADIMTSNAFVDYLKSRIWQLIKENNLTNSQFELKIIKGAQKSLQQINKNDLEFLKSINSLVYNYNLVQVVEAAIKSIDYINISNITKEDFSDNTFQIVDEYDNLDYQEGATLSKRFAFDTLHNKFVTSEIFNTKKIKNHHKR